MYIWSVMLAASLSCLPLSASKSICFFSREVWKEQWTTVLTFDIWLKISYWSSKYVLILHMFHILHMNWHKQIKSTSKLKCINVKYTQHGSLYYCINISHIQLATHCSVLKEESCKHIEPDIIPIPSHCIPSSCVVYNVQTPTLGDSTLQDQPSLVPKSQIQFLRTNVRKDTLGQR